MLVAPKSCHRRASGDRHRFGDRHLVSSSDPLCARRRKPGEPRQGDRVRRAGDRAARGRALRVPVRPTDACRPTLARCSTRLAARPARLAATPRRTRAGSDPHRPGGIPVHHRSTTRPGFARDGAHVRGCAPAIRARDRHHGVALAAVDSRRCRRHPRSRAGGVPDATDALRRNMVRAAAGRRPRPTCRGNRHGRARRQGIRAGTTSRRPTRKAQPHAVFGASSRRVVEREIRADHGRLAPAGAGGSDRPRRVSRTARQDHRGNVSRVRHLHRDDDRSHPNSVVGHRHGAAGARRCRACLRRHQRSAGHRRSRPSGGPARRSSRSHLRRRGIRIRHRTRRPDRAEPPHRTGRDRRRRGAGRVGQDRVVLASPPVLRPDFGCSDRRYRGRDVPHRRTAQ